VVGEEADDDGTVDPARGAGLLDLLVQAVDEQEVAVSGDAERLAGLALAPLPAVERPEAHDVGVLVGAVHERLDVVLHELGGRVGIRGAVVGAELAREAWDALALHKGVPLGVGLEVAELPVLVGIALVLVAEGIGVLGPLLVALESRVVVGIGVVRVEELALGGVATAGHLDAELSEQGMVALLDAPVVHAIACHPEQEGLVAAILPGVEAACLEVGPLCHVEVGNRVRGERPVVCGM